MKFSIILLISLWGFLFPHFCSFDQAIVPTRNFIPLKGFYSLQTPSSSYSHNRKDAVIRVLQFNVLADGLALKPSSVTRLSRVPVELLDWKYRKDKLLYEILQYHPDVITMQEVDHYYDFFWPKLQEHGYVGVFAPKPTSGTLDTNPYPDGCAIFIQSKRLRIITAETKTLALSKAELKDNGELDEDARKIQALNQVGLIVACELLDQYGNILTKRSPSSSSSEPAPPIIIGTTHLKSLKTELGERFRKRGIEDVLNCIQKIYLSFASMGRNPAILLTGDLNAIPKQIDFPPLTYQVIQTSPFNFRSIYNDDIYSSSYTLSCKELYTTYKAIKMEENTKNNINNNTQEMIDKKCVDYIFYMPYRNINNIRNEMNEKGMKFNQTTFNMYRKVIKNASGLKNIFHRLPTITTPSSSLPLSRITNKYVISDEEEVRRTEREGEGKGEGEEISSNTTGGVAVTSDSLIGLSSLLRYSVYFFLITSPVLSMFSDEIEEYEKFILFSLSFSYLLFFEKISQGTIFKPFIKPKYLRKQQLYESVIHNIIDEREKKNKKKIEEEKRMMKRPPLGAKLGEYIQALQEKESLFLSNVALWSQQLQPLLEYGHPGFQPVAVLDLYSEDMIGDSLLPSKDYPSDHLAIAADLELLW